MRSGTIAAALALALLAPSLGATPLPLGPSLPPTLGPLVGPDGVAAALALAAGAAGVALPARALPPAPRGLEDALLDLCRAAGLAPGAAEARALARDARALPPAWRAATAMLADAAADAARAQGAGRAAEMAAALVVADAVAAVAPLLAGASLDERVDFEDPCRLVRLTNLEEDDAHARPAWILVDARGNDRYTGAHAGATPVRPVAILIDLAGDDVYEAGDDATTAAHGASALGVVGFLFDAQGDDAYTAARADGRPAAYQGGCWGSGAGILVDAAGRDTYTARLAGQGGAQGAGHACVGLLLDAAGDDRYRATGGRGHGAQGGGQLAGVGVLVDRAGDDRYDATVVAAQGKAHLGVGILVDGSGRDAYNGEDRNNRIDRHLPDPLPGEPLGASVRADLHGLPTAAATLVYAAEAQDADGDGVPGVRLRRHDANVAPDGTISYTNDGYLEASARRFLGDPDDLEGLERVRVDGPARCVVAFVDSGINPYHVAFRDPSRPRDPAALVPGFPAGARALDLSLDAPTYAEAVARDADKWASVATGVLHTFPGTRVVGGVSFGPATSALVGERRILDDHAVGHGTAVAGAALALGPDCLVVAVEAGDVPRALRWVAAQPWIDAVGMSLGSPAGAYLPSEVANATRLVARSGKPVFVAAGNGATGIDVPDPTLAPASPYSGPAWVVSVGAVSPWNEQPVWWGSFPVDASSLGVNVSVPRHDSLDATRAFSGSSAAAPRVAGAAGAALLAARAAAAAGAAFEAGPLADGALTRWEWERAVLLTAREAPVNASLAACAAASLEQCLLRDRWYLYLMPALPGAEYATAGFGIVDAASRDRAAAVLLGLAPLPDRPEDERLWRASHAAREQLWAAHDDVGVLYLTS